MDDVLARLREICLSLPEAEEKPFGGHTAPSFRIRDKLFAMMPEDGTELWVKGAPGVQEEMIASAPEVYFRPPYVGAKGWVGIRLELVPDWGELAELVEDSYRLIAPKRLSAQLDG